METFVMLIFLIFLAGYLEWAGICLVLWMLHIIPTGSPMEDAIYNHPVPVLILGIITVVLYIRHDTQRQNAMLAAAEAEIDRHNARHAQGPWPDCGIVHDPRDIAEELARRREQEMPRSRCPIHPPPGIKDCGRCNPRH